METIQENIRLWLQKVGASIAVFHIVVGVAFAGELPALINFDSDIPGSPPATGGTGQPSELITLGSSSVRVEDSAFGIESKPVVIQVNDSGSTGNTGGIGYEFSSVTTGILRVEAIFSLN